MLIVLCSLLAASPVPLSLLPQTSAVRLLDESTELSRNDSAQDDRNGVSPVVRIAAEAVAGALLGGGLGAGGAFLGMAVGGSQGGFNTVLAVTVFGFLGLEIGEIVGITLAGSALGWHGTLGQVILGNVIGVAAMLVLGPVLGLLMAVVGPVPALVIFGLVPLISGIAASESGGNDRARPMPSGTPAALTLRF